MSSSEPREPHERRRRLRSRIRRSCLRRTRLKCSFTASLALLFYLACQSAVKAPERLVRFMPRLQREVRRWLTDWEKLCTSAKLEKTYSPGNANPLVHVISLNRTSSRKTRTIRSLQRQGVPFRIFDAVDGFDRLDQDNIAMYAGSKRKARLLQTAMFTDKELTALYSDYRTGRLRDRVRQSLHERLQFGCYMSHVTLWKEILTTDSPFYIVLEDDVLLGDEFLVRLMKLLHSVPESWGIIYLNGSEKKYGPRYSSGLVLARGGVGAFGYIISHKAARHMLEKAVIKSNRAIDHVVDAEVLSGRLLAFHAVPPLVEILQDTASTLAYG